MSFNTNDSSRYIQGLIFDILIDICIEDAKEKVALGKINTSTYIDINQKALQQAEEILAIVCKNGYDNFAKKLFKSLEEIAKVPENQYC